MPPPPSPFPLRHFAYKYLIKECSPIFEHVLGQVLYFLLDRTTSIGKSINSYLQGTTELEDHAIHLLFSANRWEAVWVIFNYWMLFYVNGLKNTPMHQVNSWVQLVGILKNTGELPEKHNIDVEWNQWLFLGLASFPTPGMSKQCDQ